MTAKKIIPPDVLAEARRLYEQTNAPVGDVAAMVGLARSNLYDRARELGWRSRRARPTFSFAGAVREALHAPAETQDAPAAPLPPVAIDAATVARQRVGLAHRMLVVAERELDGIERIVAVLRLSDPLEAEHGARTLASVSRVLRDISLLTNAGNETPSDDDAIDPVPRDVDEFRNELARRIRNLSEERTAHRRGSSGGATGKLVS
ncbi:MAG: hypothetical protein KIT48_05785 [Pseudolabrys sp.]|nr:hypothetical protein [Pseudolabrys sp.]